MSIVECAQRQQAHCAKQARPLAGGLPMGKDHWPGTAERKMPRAQNGWRSALLQLAALGVAIVLFPARVGAETKQLRIGAQYGLGYLPLYVAEEAHLFEIHMRQEGIDPIPVQIVHMASGAQINEGLLSGNLELGSGGYTAMMVACDKTRGGGDSRLLGTTALSSVPYELFTVNPELKAIHELKPDKDKIGVPSVKVSVPAIYLQMEAERLFGPGKHAAFDELTVSLSQPDGVISLLSGGATVNGYLFSPPFAQQVTGKPGVHKVWSSNDLFGSPATALTTWTTVKFHRESPKLLAAFIAALRDAMAFIRNDPGPAAVIYLRSEKTKLELELIGAALADAASLRFGIAPEQSERIADFLARTGSIKAKPASWKDLFFPDIHGENGS
jgi:NitT/TauT family transport system substrate-binding protein